MYDIGDRLTQSGFRLAYRQQSENKCPECSQSHWLVGRVTAECAFCGTALPLVTGGVFGSRHHLRTGPTLTPLAA